MRLLAVTTFALLLLRAADANAQSASDPDKLFADGLTLLGEERFDEALRKLEEAQALDPGIGTQFNIALCYEKLGKLGTAWRHYLAVQQLAHASGKAPREENARLKLEELRPRLSVLAFTMEDAAGATLKVDGATVPAGEWASYPVDPGPHRIDVEATARKPWTQTLEAPAPGGRLEIKVPALESSKETEVVTVTKETTNGRRTLGFILGGVGIAGLVTATVTGILILGDKSTADEVCRPKCLNADGTLNKSAVDDVNQGKTLVPINFVAWGVGLVGVGVGTYLLLTSTTKVTPAVDNHGAGLLFSGTL
jgi:hypothetical protein